MVSMNNIDRQRQKQDLRVKFREGRAQIRYYVVQYLPQYTYLASCPMLPRKKSSHIRRRFPISAQVGLVHPGPHSLDTTMSPLTTVYSNDHRSHQSLPWHLASLPRAA